MLPAAGVSEQPGNNGTSVRDAGLRARLAWVTGLRLLLLLIMFGVITGFYLQGSLVRYNESTRLLYIAFVLSFALAASDGMVLRAGKHLRELAHLQIVADALIWTGFVYVSGGPTSGATSFYALTGLVGAVLIGARGATLAAACGLLSYTALCLAFAQRWILPPADQAIDAYVVNPGAMTFPFLVNVLGIGIVALLSGYLAERLRTTGGKLEEAEERALAAERLATLGRVAAGLAHEIRNPLGSIRGSIELLGDSPSLSAEDRELCAIVQRESKRLESLVSDMMDLARPRKPKAERTDLAFLAKEIIALASNGGERSAHGDVAVEYHGPNDGTFAECDGEQMRQVLWNLVRNAVQVSEAGKKVQVLLATEARAHVLSVVDQGPGITRAQQRLIFDAFYTTRTQGAGLGLAVVKRIVDDHKEHGVSIEIESEAQEGAVFKLRFPAV
jgi:two-component system, NtrC family, sensor histidine kinase HydH